jgi:tetrahydromethanopterin S-methyltransferase subunit G
MTADGFDRLEKRMDNLEGRMGGVEGGISAPEEQMRQVNMRLDSIEKTLKMHDDDIKEILKLLDVLVERVSLTERERELAALTLGNIVDWAQKASKKLGIPLKLKAS